MPVSDRVFDEDATVDTTFVSVDLDHPSPRAIRQIMRSDVNICGAIPQHTIKCLSLEPTRQAITMRRAPEHTLGRSLLT